MKLSLYYGLALIIIALDQWTKQLVKSGMELGESRPIIDGVLHLTSHRNAGAAFGILQGQQWLFFIVTVVVTIFIIYYMQTHARFNPWYGIPLGLVFGGAIGNFIDRLAYGEVVDFIDVYIGTYSFPIFNVADMALVVGVGFLIVRMFMDERKEKEQNANE
ncbi:signal peptidase II [Salsuginibacillus halophilus]|uniref:Lipoprotein signal peptidase n=1 Tax=Salsuginibacillus halophilus TaxID=517424 RepID=A0A2P8HX47_9BACI|nr:signal peptidase II [Salsuginibacillus halophilus]PSL50754.1 signal peptidase II [Salsuginibacillus halophilus]